MRLSVYQTTLSLMMGLLVHIALKRIGKEVDVT
jgi:hypothetical protein